MSELCLICVHQFPSITQVKLAVIIYFWKGRGVGNTHITGRHIGGGTHITSDMFAGIYISRGYTCHCDTGKPTEKSKINRPQVSMGYINNSRHLARKYARIFVRGHYLFREANSFLRAKLEENCELRGTDNV